MRGVDMAKILIVEDEKAINDLVKMNLELVGHSCKQAYDGSEALDEAESRDYDLVILDVMLPEMSGFEVIKRLGKTPVIFVTARAGVEDRLKGLKLGADDYIVKPFEILELVERVKAVLRRTKAYTSEVEFDGILVRLDERRVYKNGKEVELTPKEFDLLEMFVNNRNLALSRECLINTVWEFDYEGDTRTVDVHVQRLRQKLGIAHRLVTVYKIGYRLEI